jgi:hypothetical protein
MTRRPTASLSAGLVMLSPGRAYCWNVPGVTCHPPTAPFTLVCDVALPPLSCPWMAFYLAASVVWLLANKIILSAPAVIERAAIAGRARARKRATDALLAGVPS